MREKLFALGFGLGFCVAVLGIAAVASTMGDPWGAIVLFVLAPVFPFMGNRGSSLLPALVMLVLAWTIVGTFIWVAVIAPIRAARENART